MNEQSKTKHKLKFKRKHKVGHSLTFLKHKRVNPVISIKNKSKEKKWENQLKKFEENLDFDTVKNNFQHFFHLNLEEGSLDKDLAELEKEFTPFIFWKLINFSYFQDNCMKEKIDNLKKELEIDNYNEDVLLIEDESENNEKKIGYRYNSLLTDLHDSRIKSDFFKQLKSLIEYIKKNNNVISINLENDKKEELSSIEKDKNLIKIFIKKIHQLNEKNLNCLKKKIENYDSLKSKKKENYNKNIIPKKINYIKYNPLLELNHDSILKFNKLIDYINNKENVESQNFEGNKKIFSFSEKFTNNSINNNINNNSSSLTLSNNITSEKNNNSQIMTSNICCICNNGEVEQNQLLFRCEQCGIIVHQYCYGAHEQDFKNWMCDACKEMSKEEVYNLECFLCPVKGGAFKKIELPIESSFYKKIMEYKHNKNDLPNFNYNIIIPKDNYNTCKFAWVHLSCALWNYKIGLKNYEKKSGISIENIKYEDFNSFCVLCKKDNCGPTIKCNCENCECKFHPECARINNCCLEVEIINKEYQYNVYCYKHKPNLFAKRVNMNIQNEIEQIILVNHAFNNIYDLYKKIHKKEFFDRPKIINEIKINIQSSFGRKYKKQKFKYSKKDNNNLRKSNSKSLGNIVISLKKRGRKRKNIKCTSTQTNYNNSDITFYDKKKNLSTIQIENYNYENNKIANTIINNIGNGNNINIYVNNYNLKQNLNNDFSIININNNDEIKKLPKPTIEIDKNEFDNYTIGCEDNSFELKKYIQNPNEFIVYLIGFLNDYTLKNRIFIKKNPKEKYSIYKKAPIYFLPYSNFSDDNFPWELMGYNNLPVTYLKKAFFNIVYNEQKYKELFLSKIDKTLRELKKNKKYERFQITCDNKEGCIGAENGVYDLLSLDIFKYKIFDDKQFFPKKFVCPSCISNTPRIFFKNKKVKDVNNQI